MPATELGDLGHCVSKSHENQVTESLFPSMWKIVQTHMHSDSIMQVTWEVGKNLSYVWPSMTKKFQETSLIKDPSLVMNF